MRTVNSQSQKIILLKFIKSKKKKNYNGSDGYTNIECWGLILIFLLKIHVTYYNIPT